MIIFFACPKKTNQDRKEEHTAHVSLKGPDEVMANRIISPIIMKVHRTFIITDVQGFDNY